MTENFGLTQTQLNFIKTELESVLKSANSYKVYIFGSRAKGTERKYSDLDLWVEASPSLSLQKLAEFLERIENSELPIKIDIVTSETCLEQYRDRILRERVVWFFL